MDLATVIGALSDPAAYPARVTSVEVKQTHISAVFLAGGEVYKIKKPVNYGFLDFSTLEKRRYYCDEEVRLNRRLAPDVYLGVVPVTLDDGQLRVEGNGDVVEWAVKMRRLPDEVSLAHLLRGFRVDAGMIDAVARRIAEFHRNAESGPHVSEFGRLEVVAQNARDNFEQSADQVGTTVNRAVFDRARTLTDEALELHGPLIDDRARRHVTRDTHGDLRLDHIYYFPDQRPPGDLVIVDCIEFSQRYRYADPVSDIAFLYMGLVHHGRRDLAGILADVYFAASGDHEGRALLPFYASYRAAVRGKVEGLKIARPEITDSDCEVARRKARSAWLVALGELEQPSQRPCLVLVGGLPGTGKSTLARGLADHAGFAVIRSDTVRKQLAGVGDAASPAEFGAGIYTPEWTARTYDECRASAERLLLEGQRVVVDANFREEAQRRLLLDAATSCGVPGVVLICRADAEIVRARLAQRRGDASDADWRVYLKAAELWEPPGSLTQSQLRYVDSGQAPAEVLAEALAALREFNLA